MPRSAWPLIGRREILDQARRLLRRQDLSGMVLAGPAGVGKTRLGTEIADLGADAGFHVERVVASQSARGIPFGALAPILPPATLAVERGVAMLGQATEGLMQRSGGRRLLLFVDDAQWLDDASALLFQQLVSAGTVFAVATVRTGEPAPDAVQAVWKNGLCDRIDVGPLDRPHAEELVERVLGAQVEGAAQQELWETSEGNLQYLRELVLSGLDGGSLVEQGGLWRIVGTISPSGRLQDLVGERLAGLDDEELAMLELIAFGEPLGVDVLATLVGADALVRLERKGLVETAMDGRRFEASLAHPVHGEVVREQTPLVRAREVKRQLADAIEACGSRRRSDVLKVAIWRVDAGGDTSREVLIEAARQASFAHDISTALRLAGAAHDLQADFASGQILADALYTLGRSEETEDVLADLDDTAADDSQRVTLVRVRVYNRYWRDGDLDAALAAIDEGRSRITEPEHRAELESLNSVLEVTSGRIVDGVTRALPLLETTNERTVIQAALASGLGLPVIGRYDEARAALDKGLRAFASASGWLNLYEPSLLGVAQALAAAYEGDLAGAAVMAEEGYERALREDDAAGWAFYSLARGVLALDRGQMEEAGRWWTEASGLFRFVNHHGPLGWALLGLALVHAWQGDAEAAAAVLDEEAAIGHPADFHGVNRHRARAWAASAAGHPAEALAHIAEGAERARVDGLVPFAAMVLHDQARLGAPEEALAGLAGLDPEAIGSLGRARHRHVAAMVAADPDDLGAAADDLAALGALLLAAEAGFGTAAELRRRNRSREATAWSRRAASWADRCPGARTPGLVLPDEPVALTKREREVAVLAASGITSKDIAERLFVSVRTVDNHLGRVYDKLGISSRAELTELMGGE